MSYYRHRLCEIPNGLQEYRCYFRLQTEANRMRKRGLASAMSKLGINPVGDAHDALVDARHTLMVLEKFHCRMLEDGGPYGSR